MLAQCISHCFMHFVFMFDLPQLEGGLTQNQKIVLLLFFDKLDKNDISKNCNSAYLKFTATVRID